MSVSYSYRLGICLLFAGALILSACASEVSQPQDIVRDETPEPTPTETPIAPHPTSTASVEGDAVGGGRGGVRSAFSSVVRIQTDLATGSGFVVIDQTGDFVVVTNAHVIEDASTISIIDPDDEIWPVVQFYPDPIVDLAVLTVPDLSLPPLPLAEVDIDVADEVWVVGFPLDLLGEPTVTNGVVSGRRQFENVSHLQIDAAINPGNSGGPVLNEYGEVVGVATSGIRDVAGMTIESIGFALPTSRINSLLASASSGTAQKVQPRQDADPPPPSFGTDQSPPHGDAAEEIRALINGLPGSSAGVVLLPNGSIVEQSAERQVPAGSVIKLWIAAAAFDEAFRGGIDLTGRYTIRAEDQAPGTGILNQAQYRGASLTYYEIIEIMMLYSDNSAANILINRIGGFDRVNQYIRAAGYENTRIQRYLGYLDPSSENYTSARDCAVFLLSLLSHDVVNSIVSEDILDMLSYRPVTEGSHLDLFGRALPPHAQYAHISGILPAARNEVGYLITESGKPVVIVLLLDILPDESLGERAISSTVAEIYYLID